MKTTHLLASGWCEIQAGKKTGMRPDHITEEDDPRVEKTPVGHRIGEPDVILISGEHWWERRMYILNCCFVRC